MTRFTPYAYPFEAGTPDLSAKVDVELADGRVLGHLQSGFRGHTTHPSTMADILAKYTDLTDGIVPKEIATAIADLVQHLQDLDDITSLTRLLATPVQA